MHSHTALRFSLLTHTDTLTHAQCIQEAGQIRYEGRMVRTEKGRASWWKSTLTPKSHGHVFLNETVLAENKVSKVAARAGQRPWALLSICSAAGTQPCSPPVHFCPLCSISVTLPSTCLLPCFEVLFLAISYLCVSSQHYRNYGNPLWLHFAVGSHSYKYFGSGWQSKMLPLPLWKVLSISCVGLTDLIVFVQGKDWVSALGKHAFSFVHVPVSLSLKPSVSPIFLFPPPHLTLLLTTFEEEHTVGGVFVKGRQMGLIGRQVWWSAGCCVCTRQYASVLAECYSGSTRNILRQ